jgi:hypothetical protein
VAPAAPTHACWCPALQGSGRATTQASLLLLASTNLALQDASEHPSADALSSIATVAGHLQPHDTAPGTVYEEAPADTDQTRCSSCGDVRCACCCHCTHASITYSNIQQSRQCKLCIHDGGWSWWCKRWCKHKQAEDAWGCRPRLPPLAWHRPTALIALIHVNGWCTRSSRLQSTLRQSRGGAEQSRSLRHSVRRAHHSLRAAPAGCAGAVAHTRECTCPLRPPA